MRINFKALASNTDIRAVLGLLHLSGQYQGNEYVALNPTRIDNNVGSFRINLSNGKWADFATGDSGGDIISYVAYVKGISQFESAKLIVSYGGNHND
jgi:hypothetical protein